MIHTREDNLTSKTKCFMENINSQKHEKYHSDMWIYLTKSAKLLEIAVLIAHVHIKFIFLAIP